MSDEARAIVRLVDAVHNVCTWLEEIHRVLERLAVALERAVEPFRDTGGAQL